MNLLLFTNDKKVYFIVSRIPRKPGPRGELGKFAKIRQKIHDTYETIRHRFDYQENVCVSLRHADHLNLHYSSHLPEPEARIQLEKFLRFRLSKHKRWFIVDLILAGLGALLTPIPGPNVFFFYPAARALSHYLAIKGVKRIRTINLNLNPTNLIKRVEKSLSNLDEVSSEIEELEQRYDIHDIRDLLEKL
jgi:hypothetical protein